MHYNKKPIKTPDGHVIASSINKLLTKNNTGKDIESYIYEEIRQIIITKNKRKTNNGYKNYYSYKLNLPLNYIQMYLMDRLDLGITFNTYLKEQNRQRYTLEFSSSEMNDAIKTELPVNNIEKTITLTLPKKHMDYLQAYDTYQDVIEVINQEIIEQNNNAKSDDEKTDPFKVQPLTATISFTTNIDETTQYNIDNIEVPFLRCIIDEISISINTNIDDRFIEYAKKDNANRDGLPGWLETLKIDWQHEKLNEMFGIESNVNKWQY